MAHSVSAICVQSLMIGNTPISHVGWLVWGQAPLTRKLIDKRNSKLLFLFRLGLISVVSLASLQIRNLDLN